MLSKDELIEIAKYKSISVINILDTDIYVFEDIGTILRIGHTSEMIQCEPDFLKLDPKVQEMMVFQVKRLLVPEPKDRDTISTFVKSDTAALEFITQKYPDVPKKFWVDQYREILSVGIPYLTAERMINVQNFINNLS